MNPDLTIEELQSEIFLHMKMFNIFDLPAGRHKHIVEEFYVVQKQPDKDEFEKKLRYTADHLHYFNTFLEKQGKYKSDRLDVERQAYLEPERTRTAIESLAELGFRAQIVSNTEINFMYKGQLIKYFPYSGWASGKTIKDGRGLKNLLIQLEPENKDKLSTDNTLQSAPQSEQ